MMSAVRVARAFTGRSRILKFAGNYHGHFDPALIEPAPRPAPAPAEFPKACEPTCSSRDTTISLR